ncbi:MAG: penicillin-binding protein 2 [Minisyncoccia bacterium]
MAYQSGRIRWFSIIIFSFGLLLVGRLYFLQIVQGEDFKSLADKQYVRSTYDYFDRGSIFFTSKGGNLVPAASLKTGFILSVHPDEMTDVETAYEKTNNLISIDKNDFTTKALKKGDPEERLLTKLDKGVADKIDALKIKGIHLAQERWRFYPGNTLAAHTLGFIGYDEKSNLNGRYGLERFYENTLGRNNSDAYTNFFVEVFSGIKKVLVQGESLEGDIVTTIEPSVQAYLENQLQGVINDWHSEYAGGIIMDPINGEIYAMALVPTFDPNNVQKEKSVAVFQNKLVESVYEMGSIVKPLTMAAGIDGGVVTPQSTYFDAGSVTLNGKTISNYDHRGRGLIPMQEVLNQSLNTGTVFVATKLGREQFTKYMKAYGLGQETGIDLPNETHGLINNLDSKVEVDYATAAFGQGIAITPIETIRALASLSNGGFLVNPHIVKQINYKLGGEKVIVPDPSLRILKQSTSEAITSMLIKVVDTALLHGQVKQANYSIAAKTGTAQVVRGKVYATDEYLHSFFGYFPAYKPRFIVFLFNMYPKNVQYASETLTHPFIDIAKFLINYYEIPPDR